MKETGMSILLVGMLLMSGCGGSSDQEKVDRALGKANTFYRQGLFKDALTHYQEALALAPTNAEILVAEGLAYEGLQLNRDALTAYEEALRYDPKNETACRQKALILVKDGKVQDAEAFVASLESKSGMDKVIPYLKGEIARAKNEWGKAVQFYEQANQARPGTREIIAALSTAYERTGKDQQAIELLDDFLKTSPNDVQAAGELASIYERKGEISRAIDILSQASKAQPNAAPVHSALAHLYLENDQTQNAEQASREALRLDPDDAMGLYVSGSLALKAGNNAQALKDLESAVKRRPNEELFRKAYREAQIATGEVVEKVKAVSQKIQKQGTSPSLQLELADAYIYQGEPEKALERTAEVLKQDPDNKNAHLLEALAFVSLSRFPNADQALQAVNDKQDVRYQAMEGVIRQDANQLSAAVDKLNAASATQVWAGYFRALGLLYGGKISKGLEELDSLIQKNETFGAAVYEMARVYQVLNEPQLALALYQRLAATFPESTKPMILSARTLVRIGHLERAKIVLDGVLKREEKNRDAFFLLGTIYLQEKKFEEGAKVFESLIASATDNQTNKTFYQSVLAKTLVYDRQYKKALDGYDTIIAAYPKQSAAYIEKSLAQMALGQDKEALETCQAALKASTDTNVLNVVQAVILQQMGQAAEGLQLLTRELSGGKWENAATRKLVPIQVNLQVSAGQYDTAKETVQKSGFPPVLVSYMTQSVEMAQQKKSDLRQLSLALLFSFYQWPDAALGIYEDLARDYPKDKLMLVYLGDAQGLAGRHEDAVKTYTKGLEVDPNDAYFLEKRGASFAKLGRYDSAVKDLSSALAVTPENASLQFQIASLYESQNLTEDAIASYRTVVKLNPDPIMTAAATNNLAWLLAQNEKTRAEALEYAKKALETIPVNPRTGVKDGNVLDTVGWIYFLAGQYEEARKHIEQALTALPTHPTINYHLGRVYEELKQPKVAVIQYSKAIDFGKENFKEADDARLRATRLATEIGNQ
jgi:tetratricopeptide (TPR) repeat protein